MNSIDNNQFEIKPTTKSKRKIAPPCPNVYLNPALDLLANEDPICNVGMEVVPVKKRKRTKSCDIAAFENTALDLGISKAAVNEFLVRELENVKRNIRTDDNSAIVTSNTSETNNDEPIYANLTEINNLTNNISKAPTIDYTFNINDSANSVNNLDDVVIDDVDSGVSFIDNKSTMTSINNNKSTDIDISAIPKLQTSISNHIIINNPSNLSLSFIDRLALDSPSLSNQSLVLDDDLNESNIMEIKTITIITKKKRVIEKKNTNPFLDPNINEKIDAIEDTVNPFVDETVRSELTYQDEALNRPVEAHVPQPNALVPRRLFINDTNSTISTMNESTNVDENQYENIDDYRSDSPIYENVCEELHDINLNKQSKLLGCDVSQFSAVDIMNLNKLSNQSNCSSESNDSKKDLKYTLMKAGKLSKKVFKTLKKTFKHEKQDQNTTLNPYEVPRKTPKQKPVQKESGIENPALNLDNSDDLDIEELEDDEEHQYETIKTLRNTRLNMNVTPLKERAIDNIDCSPNKTSTPGKKVRFDSTLNQEKIITGNSFDYDIQSPGFDAKIDKYHDELENCINERKFLQQNM